MYLNLCLTLCLTLRHMRHIVKSEAHYDVITLSRRMPK